MGTMTVYVMYFPCDIRVSEDISTAWGLLAVAWQLRRKFEAPFEAASIAASSAVHHSKSAMISRQIDLDSLQPE